MDAGRRYDDPCGVARALDVIGDRWALLVVRELTFGPKRFGQLRAGLHGISPNVLAQRLRDLQDAGVVRQDVLDLPAAVAVYELTDRGQALEPILLELGRWGSRQPAPTAAELSVSALMLAFKTVFDPAAASDTTLAIRADGEWFTIVVAGESITIRAGRPEQPVTTLMSDVTTLRAVAFGRDAIQTAERDGRLTITGDRRAATMFTRMFAVPPAEPLS